MLHLRDQEGNANEKDKFFLTFLCAIYPPLWAKKKSNASLLAISNQVKQECVDYASSTAASSLCTIQDGKPNNLDENEGDEKAWCLVHWVANS